MKYLRTIIIGTAVLGMVVSLSGLASAEKGCKACGEGCEARIKVLKDSAVALQQSNPALAKELNDIASEKEKMVQKWKERKEKHDAKAKLLTDASTALQQSNPELAKGLREMAEFKHEKREAMEKNKAGEKTAQKEAQEEAGE